ncbi:MAG: hypothetical protein IPO21_13145 [Bacteroidales bacterium]|nr:hypothetical protein [Bacteroidales bacterium]
MGAVPVSDLSAGSRDVKVLNTISENVYKAFTEKRNVLLYPSGQIAGQGYEKIFNKKSAFLVCRDLPTDVQVIAVRITGLWGSMWSRAWVGDSPPFFPTFLRAIFMVFANLLFFLPRRKVTIEFIDVSKEARKYALASIKDFNSYLESIYNEKGEEPVLFLKHYFFAPMLKRNLPPSIKGSVADLLNANEQIYTEIPSDVLQKVTEIVKNKAGIGSKEIGANSNLNFDCSVDSLMLVDIIEDIEKQFTIKADISENNIKQ